MRILSFRRSVRAAFLLSVLVLTLPLAVGGCPDFRNSVVDSVQGAVETVVLSEGNVEDAGTEALRGIAGALIDLIFSRFRTSATTTF
jgi:hypothetical protein